jgi:hypothetical protein
MRIKYGAIERFAGRLFPNEENLSQRLHFRCNIPPPKPALVADIYMKNI